MIEELKKELEKWEKAGMLPVGHPNWMDGAPGISIDMLQQQVMLQTLIDYVKDKLGMTENEFLFMYQEHMLDRLKTIREANEERIKKERALGPQLAVAESKLLGPNGQPIH
jgi:hypothetical protein